MSDTKVARLNPNIMKIPSADMGKMIPKYCPFDGEPSSAAEFLKGLAPVIAQAMGQANQWNNNDVATAPATGDAKAAAEAASRAVEQKLQQLINGTLPLINKPRYDFCRGSATGGGWYQSSGTSAPEYTMNKGFWSLLKLNPLAESDTFYLCNEIIDSVDLATESAPNEIKNELYRQADVAKLKESAPAAEGTVAGTKEPAKIDFNDFNKRVDACANALSYRSPFVTFGGREIDLKTFCLDTMVIVSPEDASAKDPASGDWNYGQTAKETPGKKLSTIIDDYLLDIRWNRWIQRYDFCQDAVNDRGHKVAAVAGDFVGLALLLGRWAGRSLFILIIEKTLVKWVSAIYDSVKKAKDTVGDAVKERRAKKARGNGDKGTKTVATDGATAEGASDEAAAKDGKAKRSVTFDGVKLPEMTFVPNPGPAVAALIELARGLAKKSPKTDPAGLTVTAAAVGVLVLTGSMEADAKPLNSAKYYDSTEDYLSKRGSLGMDLLDNTVEFFFAPSKAY